MTLNTGAQLTRLGASTLFSDDSSKEQKWKSFLTERAKSFTQDLGELKGSLMKAGQMLSMFGEHFLPPEANEFLKTLQSQSPPLDWPVIEKALRENLSAELLSELDIEKTSIGSASLGQVHRATIRTTGEKIALKVQYPGVDKAIDSDLKALKRFLSVLKVLPQNLKTDHLFEEVRGMLVQEMDYNQEREQTELYAKRLADDPRFVVPKVYARYCGPRIIATSFEGGLPSDSPMIQALQQERKNKIALNFIDLYFKELFEWGTVQTDPHLGNYKIRISPDGRDQLVLFDFGAVRTYSANFLSAYHRMIKGALLNDLKALHQAAAELKFTDVSDPHELLQIFEDFCLATVEPFILPDDARNKDGQVNAQGEYDWNKSTLPQRLTKMVFSMMQKFEVRPPPQEILFLDRKTGGVFIFCSVMKAKTNARPLLMNYLDKVKL